MKFSYCGVTRRVPFRSRYSSFTWQRRRVPLDRVPLWLVMVTLAVAVTSSGTRLAGLEVGSTAPLALSRVKSGGLAVLGARARPICCIGGASGGEAPMVRQ